MATNSGKTGTSGGKKSKKYQPLPAVIEAGENLPWSLEVSKSGRQAVANKDIPAGTDVLLEHPVITNVIGKYSQAVCHRCLKVLEKPANLEDGVNPCLPKYCASCKASCTAEETKLDADLLPARIKMHQIAKEQDLDTILFQLILMEEVEKAHWSHNPAPVTPRKPNENGKPIVYPTPAEIRALPSLWEKKPEPWRKKAAIALRAFHKELLALADKGCISGYQPSTLPELQELATVVLDVYKSISAEPGARDVGVGLFPVSSLFKHSCAPNCFSRVSGKVHIVRTLVDVPKGTPLTVSSVALYAPRSIRQTQIMQEKGAPCSCERCEQPLVESHDRFLDGIMCQFCGMDVILPVPKSESEEAVKKYKEQQDEIRKTLAKEQEKKAKAKGGKSPSKKHPKDSDPTKDSIKSKEEEFEKEEDIDNQQLEFWKCCHCGWVESAHNNLGTGPADILNTVVKYVSQGRYFLASRDADLAKQGEELLVQIAKEPRLQFGNTNLLEILPMLINLSLRREDWLNVQLYAAQLYDKQNFILPLFTPATLNIVDAYVHACKKKSEGAGSAVVKKSMEKKAKEAEKLRAQIVKIIGELD